MTLSANVPTKFLVISDTHNFEFNDDEERPLRLPTPKADVLLHCGDLTHCGGASSYVKLLKMLGSIDAELKLVIAGNHDLDLDEVYWKAYCGKEDSSCYRVDQDLSLEAQSSQEVDTDDPEDYDLAVKTMTGPLAKEAKVTYLNKGTHSFTLKNGARFSIYVSPYTPEFCRWAFAYEHNEDRFNRPHQVTAGVTSIATNPIPEGVDIVMTHGPPKGILDWCPGGAVGCEILLQAIRRVKPMMHCFGHIHEGNGIKVINWKTIDGSRTSEAVHQNYDEDQMKNPYPQPLEWKKGHGDQTLAVNAAIMTGGMEMKPTNAPWLISLDLPRNS